jgi:hypothetical protein
MKTDHVRTRGIQQQQTRRSELAYLLAVVSPLLLLVVLFVLGSLRETAAEARFESVVTRLKSEGVPTDNHSSTISFDQRLSKKYSIQWQDVLVAQRELNARFTDMYISIHESEEIPRPNEPWDIEPIARRYTDEAKPIFDALDELVAEGNLVWQPLVWQGFGTLLPEIQELRDLIRLLAVKFRLAVHQGDQAGAMQALELILGVNRAFDWQICLISDFVAIAHLSTHRSLIRQSLEVGFWKDEQQIQKLREQLSIRDDYDARWLQMVAGEQAMLAEELSTSFGNTGLSVFPFGVPAATKVSVLETIRLAGEIKGVGTIDHVRAIENDIEQVSRRSPSTSPTSSFTIVGIPFALSEGPTGMLSSSYTVASQVYLRDAMERRWTLAAVAIKQFQIQEGRWPDELNELTRVGLSRPDWLAIGETPFGYSVDDDEAILWTVASSELTNRQTIISAEPPSQSEDDPERIKQMEVRIR